MQRKRARPFYSSSVDFGNSIIPVKQMRKFTMKRLLKCVCLIIIGYIVYSVYQKHYLASQVTESQEAVYNADLWEEKTPVERFDENANRRVKEQINKVFEDLKRKQEIKENAIADDKSHINDKVVVDVSEDDDNDGDENKLFREGHREEDDETDQDPKDILEPGDSDLKLKEFDIEREIEERLAEVLKDSVNEVADEEIEDGEKNNREVDNDNKVVNGSVQNKEQLVIPQVIEKKEFKAAVNKIAKRLNPLEIQRIEEANARKHMNHDDDHEFPPFVTAVRQATMKKITHMIASIQQHLPGKKIYIYDLDLEKDQKKELISYCGVRVRLFMKALFPKYFSNLDNLHWKPLVIQTALAEFGHITWINPDFKLGTPDLAPLIHESHDTGILVVGQTAGYTTLAATHPSMMEFIPTNKEKLSSTPHIEIRAIMLHNTPEVHENIMKVFTACAMEESCLAPSGAKWQCKFDFTGRKPAGCHRYDESALNILLKNWFEFDINKFVKKNTYFRPYDERYRPQLKNCRDKKDIRDSEL